MVLHPNVPPNVKCSCAWHVQYMYLIYMYRVRVIMAAHAILLQNTFLRQALSLINSDNYQPRPFLVLSLHNFPWRVWKLHCFPCRSYGSDDVMFTHTSPSHEAVDRFWGMQWNANGHQLHPWALLIQGVQLKWNREHIYQIWFQGCVKVGNIF